MHMPFDAPVCIMLPYMRKTAPGILTAALVALISWGLATLLGTWVPGVSALLIAIVLGVIWRNTTRVPSVLQPGLVFTARPVLRLGIVLLGFQLSLTDIAALGWGVIVVIIAAVLGTFLLTTWLGHVLRIPTKLTLLIASGFSICGAAAVAGADSVLKPKHEHSATALGLVVLNGTAMIGIMPLLFLIFAVDPVTAGIWTGASVHEVAQVVAVGQALGTDSLKVAVTVKLGRVLMLAIVMALLALYMRRAAVTTESSGAKRPPIVPLFVIGFAAAMILRTLGDIPTEVLDVIGLFQTLLLTAAMFALGMGVHLKSLIKVGGRPVLLSLLSTITITVIGGAGALLAI